MNRQPSRKRLRRDPRAEAVCIYDRLQKIVSEEIRAHEKRDREWLRELIRTLTYDGKGVEALIDGHVRLMHEPLERRMTSLEEFQKSAQPQVARFKAVLDIRDGMPIAGRPPQGPPAPPVKLEP